MRHLNIEKIYKEAIQLAYREQLILISKLAISLQKLKSGKRRKLSELKGLGKGIWQNIDADKYVTKLRDEWNDIVLDDHVKNETL